MRRLKVAAVEWTPLVVLPAVACAGRSWLQPWQFMWLLSAGIFLGFKWQTWIHSCAARAQASLSRNVGYLVLWPGMNADNFLDDTLSMHKSEPARWLAVFAKTLFGVALIAFAARRLSQMPPLVAGWLGMFGLVLFLHFGLFDLAGLVWRAAGVDAEPIMCSPVVSTSLGDFWGKRWNTGFRELTYRLVFRPLCPRLGAALATLAAFFVSGLVHDIVISIPAHGGYGLPTAYFVLQGFGVLFERSRAGKWVGLGHGARGWTFVLLIAGAPAFVLFHPLFIRRVILPLLEAIGSWRV
jgi:Membrane bound O-acyl transferase family